MSTEIVNVLKHAALGSVVGASAALASIWVSGQITSALAPSLQGTPVTRAVVNGTVMGITAASAIFLGDRMITQIIPTDDPLFRVFYYQIAFHTGSPSYGFANAFQVVVSSIMTPSVSTTIGMNAPPKKTVDTRNMMAGNAVPVSPCDGCAATGTSCGGCKH